MNGITLLEQASELLLREARYLDRRLWDEWLDLYVDDAIFWVPAWKDEEHQTTDPDREVSMMYYEGRARLAERVWRARSGQSIASTPLPRTMHNVTNIVLERESESVAVLSSNWSVHIYDTKRKSQHVFFGFYEHELIHIKEKWLIRRKKITILNDHLPIVMDFNNI